MTTLDFRVKNGLFVSNTASIESTLQSTSSSTGALVVAGGVGIRKDLYVGGTIYGIASVSGVITTATNLANGTAGQVPYQSSPGSTNFTGGSGSAGNVFVSNGTSAPSFNNTLTLLGVVNATTTETGTLQVRGGAGIGQNLLVGGQFFVNAVSTTATVNVKASNTAIWAEAADFQGGLGGSDNSGAVLYVRNTLYGDGQGGKLYGGRWSNTDRGARLAGVSFNGSENAYIHLNSEGTAIRLNIGTVDRLSIAGTGVVTISTTSNATSTITGALVVSGGAGIGRNLWIGEDLAVLGITTLSNTTNATSTTSGALRVAGGVGIGQNLHVGGGTQITGLTTVTNGTNATSTLTGALRIAGGVGIGQDLWVGGDIYANRLVIEYTTITTQLIQTDDIIKTTNTSNATTTQTGALQISGGAGIGQNLYVGGNVNVSGLITGNLAVAVNTANTILTVQRPEPASYYLTFVPDNNSVAAAENLYTSSTIYFSPAYGMTLTQNLTVGGNTNSVSTQSGAFVVAGGAGIGQNVFIGGALTVGGSITGLAGITTTNITVTGTAVINTLTVNSTATFIGQITATNIVRITNSTSATSTVSGALQVVGGVGIGGDLYAGRIRTVSTTNAVSTTTGDLVIPGGAGIGQDVYIGGALVVGGSSGGSITGLAGLTTTNAVVTGTLTVQNLTVVGTSTFSGLFGVSTLNITSTTDATSTITGALIVTGGVGIGQTLYASRIRTASTTNAVSTQTGDIVVPGGIGVGQDVYIGGALVVGGTSGGTITGLAGVTTTNLSVTGTAVINTLTVNSTATFIGQITATNIVRITNATIATSTITGALIVSGGVGVGQELYAGRIRTSNTTNSVSTQTGDIVVPGGIGVGQDVNIGGALTVGGSSGGTITGLAGLTTTNAVITGTTNASSTTTGALIVAGGVGIGQDLRVGGTIFGNVSVSGTITTSSSVNTQGTATARSYFLTFVDANNGSPAPEVLYTSSTIYFSPASGMTITNTTNASTTLTGALTVAGGIGIGQDLQVGGDVYINGGDLASAATTFNLLNGTVTTLNIGQAGTNITIGATSGATTIRNATTVSNNANATTTQTGALQVIGGVGIGQDVYIGGDLNVNGGDLASAATSFNLLNATVTTLNLAGAGTNITIGATSGATTIRNATTVTANTNASSTITGAFRVVGGAGIGGDLYASRIRTVSTTNATSTITGEVIVGGGVGIGQDLWVGGRAIIAGQTTVTNTTNATSTLTGALQVRGGQGIGQDLHVGGNVYITGTIFASVIATTGTIVATVSTSTSTINLAGGGPLQIVYQTNTSTTGFIVSPAPYVTATTTASVILNYTTATGFTWTSVYSLVSGLALDPIIDTFTSAGNTTTFTLSVTPRSKNHVDVNIDGVDQLHTAYNISGNSLILTGIPVAGAVVEVTILSTTATNFVNGPAGVFNSIQYNNAGSLAGATEFLFANTGVNLLVTTNSVNTQTGALHVAGGVGIGQNLNVGGGVRIAGITTVTNTTSATSTTTGALQVVGGVGVQGDLYARNIYSNGTLVGGGGVGSPFSGIFTITNTTSATSTQTGALQVYGGVGIGQDLYVGGKVYGVVAQTVSTASQINTQAQPTPGTYYLTFVDSNNANPLPESLYTSSTIYFSPASGMTITNTTAANSTTNGALTVAGGVGIGGNLYVGGDIVATRLIIEFTTITTTLVVTDDIIQTTNTTQATTTNTGALIIAGGAGIGRNLVVGGTSTVTNTTNATSTTTGALQVVGGVGIGQNLYVGGGKVVAGINTITNTTNATSTQTGALQVAGGVGIGQNLYVGGNLNVTGIIAGVVATTVSTASQVNTVRNAIGGNYFLTFVDSDNAAATAETVYTSSTIYFSPTSGMTVANVTNATTTQTGAVIVTGGVGIGQNLYVGGGTQVTGRFTSTGIANVTNSTDATSTSSAALVVTGGVGIGQNLYVGGGGVITGITTITNTTNATTTQTGALQVRGGGGIGQNLHVGGQVTVSNLTNASNTTTAALIVSGGIGAGQDLRVGGKIFAATLANTTGSNIMYYNVSTGEFSYGANFGSGGGGGGGGITNPFSGVFTITNTTEATSTSTGALQVYGGVGIGGSLYATSKSFHINHPTKPGMKLNHGSLEGPEFGVYVRGHLFGANIIDLPDYWVGLVDETTITVNITPRSRRQEIYVEYVANNKVYLHGDDIDCYFIVYGERKDIDKLKVEV